jgi:hypothetical protein
LDHGGFFFAFGEDEVDNIAAEKGSGFRVQGVRVQGSAKNGAA